MKIKFNKKEYNVKVCDNFFSQARGLMFKKLKDNEALLFVFDEPVKLGLHTLFVFYPIDIYFLNENKKVVHSFLNVKPFTPYIKGVEAKYILELKSKLN